MLYIMRHGKTEWNRLRKLQGRTDIPLCDEGRKMAEAINEECAALGFDVCYTSPLLRAKETAEIALRGLDVPIITDERLVEMCFGECEGFEDAFHHPESPMYTFFFSPENYTAPKGGESFDELFRRTGEFIDEVIFPREKAGKKILIVGHGAMNSSIISKIRNLPLEKFWEAGIPNCKLIKLI